MENRKFGLEEIGEKETGKKICKLANKNKIAIGFNFNDILKSKNKGQLIGRMMQNAKLCKKYKLPKFEEIDKEFEISSLENERFLIRNTLRKIAEKLEIYSDAIGNLVHPDGSSLSSMYEVRFFSDDEKDGMYKLFKKLMKANRDIAAIVLSADEKKEADFLNDFFNGWLNMKKELIAYMGKMRESWEKESTIEEDLGYFG